jgi:hypothetical protein
MDPKDIARLIADVTGPVIGDVVNQLRAEIKEVKDVDREQLAIKIAPVIDEYIRERVKEFDVRLKALEERWIPRKDWVA